MSKAESRGRVLGDGPAASEPPPHPLGDWGSDVSSPSGDSEPSTYRKYIMDLLRA